MVLNADSMQIYDGLRVLTARPTPEEEAEADHRLYGFVDPRRAFSVGDYVRAASPLLADLRQAGRLAILVGGTGLYFRALTDGLADVPPVPPEIMAELEAMSPDRLHAALSVEDPESAARLSPADAPRLQRALAVKRATGLPLGDWRRTATPPSLGAGRWAGVFLAPERDVLYGRIDRRFGQMIDLGALEEAARVKALGLPANRGIMKAHGMPHLIAHLGGALPLDEAIRLAQRDTRNYAKRQFTWARRFMTDWRWAQV